MIRVPLEDVPTEVRRNRVSIATKGWCDEVRFVRDEHGGWWAKVVRVDRTSTPEQVLVVTRWFGLSVDSDFELALDAWLHDQVGDLDGES
jgi:hypothetical protein